MSRRSRRSGGAAGRVVEGEVLAAAGAPGAALTTSGGGRPVEAFSFGDPEPALSQRGLLDYIAVWNNGRWYDPPISLGGLSKSFRSSPHHASAIMIKVNLLVSTLIPTPWLDRKTLHGMALDYLVLGNAYAERRDNAFGRLLRLGRMMGRYTRRGVEDGAFWWLLDELGGIGSGQEVRAGSVYQLMQPDIDQEVYGVPEYFPALQAAFLNEASTIFRRRYYLNGSHAGYILYMTGATVDTKDVDALRQALRDSKGPGNFRNLFVHAPGGDKDGMKLLPISEVAAKDEFLNIKNVTRDDILAAHRVPPQLLGIVPANAGGFGNPADAAAVFFRHEVEPLQRAFLSLNDWLQVEAVKFGPYEGAVAPAPTGTAPAPAAAPR